MDHDPWFWDPGEVEAFFRTQAANTVAVGQRARLPPSESFFEALQSEGVNGECLLTAIDNTALRDEYGITSAMTRSAVWSCICKLRVQSPGYAAQYGLPLLQTQTPKSLPPADLPVLPPQTPTQHPTEPITSIENVDSAHRPGENARSGEYQVQDGQGRKRRKLNLSKPHTEPRKSSVAAPAQNYLPDSALSIDAVFYGSTGFGEEIGSLPPDGEITVLAADRDDDLDDNDFQFQRQGKTNGEAAIVHQRMQHFFQNSQQIDMERNGRDAVALLPYRQPWSETQSATVVQFPRQDAERPVAFKENVAYLNSAAPEKHAEAGGEWAFLTEKYASNDDEVLPVYGNSESALSETKGTPSDADGESMAEESVASDELSAERASDYVDQLLEQYADQWQEKVPSLEEKDAYKVWSKMRKSRTLRENLIAGARAQIEHLKTRLRKYKEQLLESQWSSESSLEKVCGNLRATVEDIELHHWKIDVWGRKKEPWHPERARKTTNTAAEQVRQGDSKDGAPARLIIPEHDRFSVSPPPERPDDTGANAEGADSGIDNQNNTYEADDDEFHTPVASPEPDHPSPDVVAGAEQVDSDEKASTPFVVDDEPDLHLEGDGSTPVGKSPAAVKKSLRVLHAETDGGSDDELPSPSNFATKRIKNNTALSTPSNKRVMCIDLTEDGPASDAPTPASKKRGKNAQVDPLLANPDSASARDIDGWSIQELVKRSDRKRILMKILRNAGRDTRDKLHRCYMALQRTRFAQKVKDALIDLQNGNATDFDNDRGDPIRIAAGIYLRWHQPELLTRATANDISWPSALNDSQIGTFSNLLWTLLQRKDTPKFSTPKKTSSLGPGSSSANPQVLSSSDNEMAVSSQRTPVKKRKREPERSQAAEGNRQKAYERMQRANLAESQSAADSSQLAAMIDTDPSNSSVFINSLKEDDQDYVYIPRKIATKMKQHQIDGARFLWREITADDEDGGHGCVLAHTMGLGKTMQTISFLAAVNEAAHSRKKAVRLQLPKHLRRKEMRGVRMLRVLILCPAGLIQNWNNEIASWADSKVGNVFCLESTIKAADRPSMIYSWFRTGGALIVGYDMFRSMINLGTDQSKKKGPVPLEEAKKIMDHLLQDTEIVVADEAHNLKNEKSGITTAASRFKTESKIALTGTPMSNDVQEVFALVSWISPGYLGDAAEFKGVFAEPIQNGLYADSTRYEQRRSIMKLKVLHKEIQPKVNRANIEALRGSIPPKVEFVIFVALQEEQKELYRRYIRAIKGIVDAGQLEDGAQKTSAVVFLGMLAVLSLLTAHPYCFKEKLLEPPKEKTSKPGKDVPADPTDTESDVGGRTPSTTSGSATPAHPEFTTNEQLVEAEAEKMVDSHVFAQGLTPEKVAQILGGDGSDIGISPTLSSKVTVFLSLLRSCMRAKDSAIIFSQRLATLDYLGELLRGEDIVFGRIDGTNMKSRMPLLDQFRKGEFNVMLVSTKAGSVGLNMQSANRVFIFDSGFNPTYEEQAIGRAYRLGQKKPVYVYRFVAAGTFEDNIYNKQLFKTSLAQRVVDKKNPRRNAERNTREYLYEPKEVWQRDITEHISKDPEVLGKLLKQHGTSESKMDTLIRDVKTMETLTEEILDEPLDQEEQKVVDEETEARKQRPRGKKAAAMAAGPMGAPASTMPASGYVPPPSRPPNYNRPPSTFAGPSNTNRLQPHPLGGLPMSRKT